MWPALIAGAVQVGSGIAAGRQAAEGRRQNAAARRQALDTIMAVDMPTIEEQELTALLAESQGELTPEMMSAIAADPSAMEGVSADPRLVQAQMQALDTLAGMSEGGLRPEDEIMMRQAQREASASSRAQQEAILQNMAQRGVSGSGLELAARQSASQAAMDRAAQQADAIAMANAQAKAQALSSMGQMAGQIRSQDVGEQQSVAQAQDILNRFNVANQRNVQSSNVGSRNVAQEKNLDRAQQLHESNLAEQARIDAYNKSLIRTRFQDEMDRAAMVAGYQRGEGQAAETGAGIRAGQTAGIGSAIGKGITAGGSYMQQQQDRDLRREAMDRGFNPYGK